MTRKPWRWGVGALIGGITLLVACDGSNLFDAEQNPFAAPRVTVSVPDGAFAGDTIGISLSASSALDLSTIDVAIRGAVTKDTTITVASGRTASSVVKLPLPTILTDTMLIVGAIATDKNGNVSKVRADTATVLGPPSIISVTGPDSLRLGSTATLQIRAFGSRRITQLDVAIRGAVSKDTTLLIVPPLNDVTQTLALSVPAQVGDTAVRVSVVARDVSGLTSPSTGVSVPLAVAPPVASISGTISGTAPGALLTIPVRATAMRQVSSIKVELRGATTMDETITITPPAADVTRDVTIRLPGDLVESNLTVRAYAIDRAGTISLPATQNITLSTGVPVVSSVVCITCAGGDSVRSGAVVDMRVQAQGVRPLKEIIVRFRGAVNNEVTVQVPTTPARTSYTADVSITLPAEVSDTILTVTAIAVDQAGDISAITAASTRVLRVSDATAPTVSATATPGSTTAGGTVQIRVNARDNVGVRRIGYAVVNPAGDTIGGSATLVNTSGLVKDTTFSFIVPSTITPRTVRVLGIAVDASGRRGISSAANVVVADSAAPNITINQPVVGATVPLNDSVRVNVTVADPSGVKTIRMRGEAVRPLQFGQTQVVPRFVEQTLTYPQAPSTTLPTSVTLDGYLRAIQDSISEDVNIIVEASDSAGNTSTATRSIFVGGPSVTITDPAPPFTAYAPGQQLRIRVRAVDRSRQIDSVHISITGAQTANFGFIVNSPDTTVEAIYTVGAALGGITINAMARNGSRVQGIATPVSLTVAASGGTDALTPEVRLVTIRGNDRVHLTDTITVILEAQDRGPAGLRRMGMVVIGQPQRRSDESTLPAGIRPDTLYRELTRTTGPGFPRWTDSLKFTLADMGFTEMNLVSLARDVALSFHAFAVDTMGNCGASVSQTLTALPCDTIAPPQAPDTFFVARSTAGFPSVTRVVAGLSRSLLNPGDDIADVVVDNNPAQPRMFMSNKSRNRLEWIDVLNPMNPLQTISVGSEPWGMFLQNAPGGDGLLGTQDDNPSRLIVANSGGTNLSFVNLATLREEPAERILTPNAILFDVQRSITASAVNYLITPHDFSDRPQFVAQDANGIYLYSTEPTGAAPDGTVRYLQPTAGPRPFESKILFTRDAFTRVDDTWALAHIDSIDVEAGVGIRLWDHVPGNPTMVFSRSHSDPGVAAEMLRAAGSDVAYSVSSRWNLAVVGLSDTTFVATSGDRRFVAFGEGATGPFASVWLWRFGPGPGQAGTLSDNLTVQDLIGNASERVVGIGLNYNGAIGAARGSVSASYFSNDVAASGDLRLQGVFSNGVEGGRGGIALHPRHNSATTCNEDALSFVATGQRSIKIVDTFHFRERGEILLRDNVKGALRAALPLAVDNPAAVIGTPDEVLVKLYTITETGKALIIDVRRRDLRNMAGGVCQ